MDWNDTDTGMTCGLCNNVEPDGNKLLVCNYCFAAVHLSCKGITGVAASRIKNKPYFCSTKCTDIYKRILEMQQNEKSLFSSLTAQLNTTVANVVSAQMVKVSEEVKTITNAVENSQKFLSDKFELIKSDFSNLKTENEQLKQEVNVLKHSQQSLTTVVNNLEMNFDKTNKQTISNNAVILGMPFLPNENITDLTLKTFQCIGVNLTPDSITSASRFYSPGRNNKNNSLPIPIRVVFKDASMRDIIINKKTEFGQLLSTTVDRTLVVNGNGSRIAIREELTAFSQKLLNDMRESQKSLKIKYVWPGRNGVILVKKDDDSTTEKITNRDDLIRIITLYKNVEQAQQSSSSVSPKRKKTS